MAEKIYVFTQYNIGNTLIKVSLGKTYTLTLPMNIFFSRFPRVLSQYNNVYVCFTYSFILFFQIFENDNR